MKKIRSLRTLAIALIAALMLVLGMLHQSRVSAAPLAATAGPNFAGSVTSFGWTDPNNATGPNDNICASVPLPASNQIDLTGFSFSLPTGSTITGIRVEPKASYDVSSFMSAQLLKAGAPVGIGKNWAPVLSGSSCSPTTFQSLGGAGDLWGATWSAGDLNASNFGVRIFSGNFCSASIGGCRLDAVRITVLYDPPVPAAPVAPAEVPEGDTLLLMSGGLGGLATWVGWQWSKRRARKKRL